MTKEIAAELEERRSAIKVLARDWMAAQDEAKGENLLTAKRRKDKEDRVLELAKDLGYKKSAFRHFATMLRHVANARGTVDKVDEMTDEAIMHQFADLVVTDDGQMGLFDSDVRDRLKESARIAREARMTDAEKSNVVRMADPWGDKDDEEDDAAA